MSRLERHRNLAFTRDSNGNYLDGHLFHVARTFHSVGQMVSLGLSSDPVFNLEVSCVAPGAPYSIPMALRLASLDPSI